MWQIILNKYQLFKKYNNRVYYAADLVQFNIRVHQQCIDDIFNQPTLNCTSQEYHFDFKYKQ